MNLAADRFVAGMFLMGLLKKFGLIFRGFKKTNKSPHFPIRPELLWINCI